MKRVAGLCLISGLLIMIFTLGMAVSVLSGNNHLQVRTVSRSTPNTCLYCHFNAHEEWQLNNAPRLFVFTPPATHVNSQPTTPESAVQPCGNCHEMTDDSVLPLEAILDRINVVRLRVMTLKQNLLAVYQRFPDWDENTYRLNKPQTQLMAERIGMLLAVVEADGSWGFHNPGYTEEILNEAESLLADLLLRAGL